MAVTVEEGSHYFNGDGSSRGGRHFGAALLLMRDWCSGLGKWECTAAAEIIVKHSNESELLLALF